MVSIPGLSNINFLKNFDLATALSGAGKIIGAIVFFGIASAIIGYYLFNKSKKLSLNNKIVWYEEVNGIPQGIGEDLATELTIPNTNVTVFYIPSKNLYLPRGTRRMGKNEFWYFIRKNREIVNFSLKNMNKDLTEANLDFDTTDMRYAKENLLELIKRNYRDKSTPWWREYKDVISTVVYVFVTTLALVWILSKIGGLIDKLAPLIDHVDGLLKTSQTLSTGSGVR